MGFTRTTFCLALPILRWGIRSQLACAQIGFVTLVVRCWR